MLDGKLLLAPFALPKNAKVVVAVSGGVDSMVLLTLLAKLPQGTLDVTAATFDHQLRLESSAEQKLVQRYAKQLGIPVICGLWQHENQAESEDAARKARYRFLFQTVNKCGASYLLTAHHGDDQLETQLFRLTRSGSVQGLIGIARSSKQHGITLLRPLLGIEKQTLYAYAKAHAVPFAEDGSNADLAYSRNRLRHQVLPLLKAQNPQVIAHAQTFSDELAGVLALAQKQSAWQLHTMQQSDASINWQPALSLSPQVQTILLKQQLAVWQLYAQSDQLAQILQALAQGHGSKTFCLQGGAVRCVYGRLQRQKAAPKAQPALLLEVDDTWHQVSSGQIGLFHQLPKAVSSWAKIPGPVTIRQRQPGDWLLLPNGTQQKLRRFFIDEKVPQTLRQQSLLAAIGHKCLWIQINPRPELFQRRQTDIIQAVLAFKASQIAESGTV